MENNEQLNNQTNNTESVKEAWYSPKAILKRYSIKNIGIAFYVSLGFTIFALIAGIMYSSVYTGALEPYYSGAVTTLLILTPILFIILSLVNSIFDLRQNWIEGGLATLFQFVALVIIVNESIPYFSTNAMQLSQPFSIEGVPGIVAIAVVLVIGLLGSLVSGWILYGHDAKVTRAIDKTQIAKADSEHFSKDESEEK